MKFLRTRLVFWVPTILFLTPVLLMAAQLVPCGQSTGITDPLRGDPGAIGCNLCAFGQLIQNVINFMIGLSIPIAVGLFAWAGILYFSSAENPGQIDKAHKIFKSVFIGLLIALSGWLVVQTLLNATLSSQFTGGWSWNTLQCVKDIGPNAGQRLDGKTVGDILGILPGGGATAGNCTAGGVCQNTRDGPYSLAPGYRCADGSTFNTVIGTCISNSCNSSVPATCIPSPPIPIVGNPPAGRSDKTDAEVRAMLAAAAAAAGITININATEPRTSLAGMQPETIAQIIALGAECGCTVTVTGGTETTGGHTCTGEGSYSHCNGWKFDVGFGGGTDAYITGLGHGSNSFWYNNFQYTRESNHWDIGYRPRFSDLKTRFTFSIR